MLQSIEIGSMCYMINWYQLSPRSVRSLILIIAMSSHPIKLTAGRMANLSLTTFGNVRHYIHFISNLLRSISPSVLKQKSLSEGKKAFLIDN